MKTSHALSLLALALTVSVHLHAQTKPEKTYTPDFGDVPVKATTLADIKDKRWWSIMVDELTPEQNKANQVAIASLKAPGKLSTEKEIILFANPGKNFKVELNVKFNSPAPSKLAANLLLEKAGILDPDVVKEMSSHHNTTWHFDTESRLGYGSVEGKGDISFDLIGKAPKEKGRYTFVLNVGLFSKLNWNTRFMREYTVTLITDPKLYDETTSSAPQPAAPQPAAKKKEPAKAADVAASQAAALKRYPALGKAGSVLNKAFVERVKVLRVEKPYLFEVASWPMMIAREVAAPKKPAVQGYILKIAAGDERSVALRNDGTVTAWGTNQDGRGNGVGASNVPVDLEEVTNFASGWYHTLAIKKNGTVVGWGNEYGPSIDSEEKGAFQSRSPAGLEGVAAVAAGGWHSMALLNDGTVTAWGYDVKGQVKVPVGLDQVVAIAAGHSHSVALKADGTVVAWGSNKDWEGDLHGQSTVPTELKGVDAIGAGNWFTVALKEDGTVIAWGKNSDGQCTPPPGLKNVASIAVGMDHVLALKHDGAVVAWGKNQEGQCDVPAGLTGVAAVAAGRDHSLALKYDGTLVAWGGNKSEQCNVPPSLSEAAKQIGAGELSEVASKLAGKWKFTYTNSKGKSQVYMRKINADKTWNPSADKPEQGKWTIKDGKVLLVFPDNGVESLLLPIDPLGTKGSTRSGTQILAVRQDP